MKSKLYFSVFFILSLTINSSCITHDDDLNFTYNLAYVTAVDASNATTVGIPVLVKVTFVVANGCGTFEQFIESKNGYTRNIEVEAQYIEDNCIQTTSFVNVNYLFSAENPGRYTLNFRSSPTEFISVSINVN